MIRRFYTSMITVTVTFIIEINKQIDFLYIRGLLNPFCDTMKLVKLLFSPKQEKLSLIALKSLFFFLFIYTICYDYFK